MQSLVEDEAVKRRAGVSGQRSMEEADRFEEAEERVQRLRQVLDQMNPEHRAVLSARYLQNLRRNEIAEMLGISEFNVKMRLYRAKKELVDRFERIARTSG